MISTIGGSGSKRTTSWQACEFLWGSGKGRNSRREQAWNMAADDKSKWQPSRDRPLLKHPSRAMQRGSPVSERPSHHFELFLPLEGLPFGSSCHHYLISWGCHSPSLKTGLAEMYISLKTVWCPQETLPNSENKKGRMMESTSSIKTDFENDILYLFLLFYLKWLLAQKGHFKSLSYMSYFLCMCQAIPTIPEPVS